MTIQPLKPTRRGALGRTVRLIAAMASLACPLVLADGADIPTANPGDTMERVVAKLGKPQGVVKRGQVTTYYYERGMVDFVDGKVKAAFLVDPGEARRRTEERDRAEVAQRQKAEADRQRLTEEGRSELDRARNDKTLAGKPAAERVAFWLDFARRYPYADASDELAKARAAVESDEKTRQQADEQQRLRDRVAAIQKRFAQLDADYAASLTHWKRNEINAERVKLEAEKKGILDRLNADNQTPSK